VRPEKGAGRVVVYPDLGEEGVRCGRRGDGWDERGVGLERTPESRSERWGVAFEAV
jgi:hypothetical protein